MHTALSHLRLEGVRFAPRPVFSKKAGATAGVQTGAADLLREISFEVFRGDRVAIVGSSGAGKTLLLRLLNRLSDPTGGTIYLNNQDLTHIPVIQLRRQVVLVLQESKLLGMTVQKALEYPLVLRGLPKKLIQQRVGEWVERLRIPSEWLARTELQLSVGQRQWVAIARALILQPDLLLLDEPTSALDVGQSEFLIRILLDLNQQNQTTILMANHQLEMAAQFCDRVLHLHEGTLIQDLVKHQIDWDELRQHLLQARQQQIDEWG